MKIDLDIRNECMKDFNLAYPEHVHLYEEDSEAYWDIFMHWLEKSYVANKAK